MRFIAELGLATPVIVAAFLAAATLALLLTPVVRRIVVRQGLLDQPNHRRVNTRPVPRGGGLAIVAAFTVVALVVLAGLELTGRGLGRAEVRAGGLAALLVGGAAAAVIGAVDDHFDLRARWQLLGQFVLAAGAVALGVGVEQINNPFGPGTIALSGPFGLGFTIFWIVGMINSINWIDGLDGLSSGIALIAAATLGVLSLTTQVDQPLVAILCFTLAGALLGFLRWNFHPATIFAGTSGVMFVGYALAILSILGTAKVAVAVLVLGVPIIDTFWIIVRRVVGGRSPFTPDRGHIHHRLLDLGLSHRQTVVVIYGICVGLAVLSFVLSGANQVYAFLGAVVGIGLLLYFVAWGGGPTEAFEADTYEAWSGSPDPTSGGDPSAEEAGGPDAARH